MVPIRKIIPVFLTNKLYAGIYFGNVFGTSQAYGKCAVSYRAFRARRASVCVCRFEWRCLTEMAVFTARAVDEEP